MEDRDGGVTINNCCAEVFCPSLSGPTPSWETMILIYFFATLAVIFVVVEVAQRLAARRRDH